MRRFTIFEDSENSNPSKKSFMENETNIKSRLLDDKFTKRNSIFENHQLTRGLPMEDERIEQLDLFSDEEEEEKKNPDSNLIGKGLQKTGDKLMKTKELPNNALSVSNKKDEKKESKKTLLIVLFNSIDLEGKYQKILFVNLALIAFICSMLMTTFPLQKEIPKFECLKADGFNANKFKKFPFKIITDEECIVNYCFLRKTIVNEGHSLERSNLNAGESSGKFLDNQDNQGYYQGIFI